MNLHSKHIFLKEGNSLLPQLQSISLTPLFSPPGENLGTAPPAPLSS